MTKQKHIEMMVFWAKQFVILREQWYEARGQEFAELGDRVAIVAEWAIMHCKEAGLQPDALLDQEVFFVDNHKQRLEASA